MTLAIPSSTPSFHSKEHAMHCQHPLRWLLFLVFAAAGTLRGLAQAQERQDTVDVLQAQAPKVFVDCFFCDEDFIRTEITWVNYVRDRKQADVHILVTTKSTAAGGDEYTLTFIGQNRAEGMNDTLRFSTQRSDTDEMIRNSLVRVLKMGLVRYAAKTPLGDQLSISYKRPAAPVRVADKWNYWVFRVNMNTNFSGEKTSNSLYLSGGMSANRTTHDWKLNFSLSANYSENNFKFDIVTDQGTETQKISSFSRGQNFRSLIVRSITDHWSIGGFASGYTSTYSNTKLSWALAPAIEYNLFPYSQSTLKELRLLYKIALNPTRYYEETIFDKTSETLFYQSLSISLDLKQPWGSVGTTLEGFHYLHDIDKKRIQLYANLSLRLVEGLSINFSGGVSRINDQLFLAKKGATQEEILLRRTQLATSYSYWGFIGLSYTFGAIFNNIVNPRFGDSGGGIIRFMF